jgi:hypothetical protein
MESNGSSWSTVTAHRWPKKGERRLANPLPDDASTHPRPRPMEETKPGDSVWFLNESDAAEEVTIVCFEPDFVYCARRGGAHVFVTYDALATTKSGLRAIRRRRDMAVGAGGF